MKFSFDFAEPGVVFGDHRFSFLIFTEENTYSLDRAKMVAIGSGDALRLTADGFVWPPRTLTKKTKVLLLAKYHLPCSAGWRITA